MTVYDTEQITLKINSAVIGKQKELKKIIENFLENSRPDYRGDDEKIMSAFSQALSISIMSEENFTIRTNIIWREKTETNEGCFLEYE